MKTVSGKKYYVLFGFIAVFFLYLTYVIFTLTVLKKDMYANRKIRQNEVFDRNDKRGTIYGTTKTGELVKLAYDEPAYILIVSPKEIPEEYDARLYSLLSNITPIDEASFKYKIFNKSDKYEELAVLNEEEARKVEELNIRGVYTSQKYKRTYPFKNIMSTNVGFVGGGEGGMTGKYGLEKKYEDDLQTKKIGKSLVMKIIGKSDEEDENMNIVTSLEPNVSSFLYNLLKDMKEEWGADSTNAIVLNIESGEIVAMESYPAYDPNNYAKEDLKNFTNKSINGVYELGSIMKPITMASGINENLVNPESTYIDKGFLKIDNFTIKNFDEKVRGKQTMQDVISSSLNTGAVYVQQLLGKERFKNYFEKFGLTSQTEVDFPNEAFNLTDNLETNTDVNFATASFGQGVAITPLGMLSALTVIPNEGKQVCPHFLRYKETTLNDRFYFSCPHELSNPISTSTAEITKNMMIELIETGLAKGRYKDTNYYVGAKTGTAQLPSPDGKYYKDRFIHSYYTFFPGNNPKYAVLIYQINPKQGSLASLTLAPFATKVKDFLLGYYELVPDKH